MKRFMMVVGIIALVPLLMGAGGGAPGIPAGTRIVGPTLHAKVVLDPHEPGATTTAKQATIRITDNHLSAAAMFTIPPFGFPFLAGCDLTKTSARFLNLTLISWIPEAVLNQLFTTLGTGRSATLEPMITKVLTDTDACTPDLANLTTTDGSLPGILSFEATINFLVPKATR
jgi:hypothetical protein